MNIAGYVLGLLLAIKLAIRFFKGYRPPRWRKRDHVEIAGERSTEAPLPAGSSQGKGETRDSRQFMQPLSLPAMKSARKFTAANLSKALAVLTVAILGFCLVSALNAFSTYDETALSFEYHSFLKWLPHSLDSHRTWLTFWNYLALACSFWAVRDWLLGQTAAEQRAERRGKESGIECQRTAGSATVELSHALTIQRSNAPTSPFFPARLRRLLWLLAINGGLLGVEAIAQRFEGSGKLLFLVKPHVNPGAESQFGPYAYRSNAAQYFNLVWPVTLGFWWVVHRSGGLRRGAHHLLLVSSAIMAACPIISISRGGALITVAILVFAALAFAIIHFLYPPRRPEDSTAVKPALPAVMLFVVAALALGFSLGWRALGPRMTELSEGFEGREEMYAAARPMTGDYPLFGVGPGAYATVFQLYRISTDTYWPAQLHNDWLETLITFGWVGTSLIVLALVVVLLRWFAPGGGIHGGRRFTILMWFALAGCLLHARFDFPFQIYSILFLFLVLCAVTMNLGRKV
jgi:O-antigen ligase